MTVIAQCRRRRRFLSHGRAGRFYGHQRTGRCFVWPSQTLLISLGNGRSEMELLVRTDINTQRTSFNNWH